MKVRFLLKSNQKSMWNGEIRVITGLRRSGKSVLLFELFKDYLIESGVNEENIIALTLDQRKHYKFRNPITLCDSVENITGNYKKDVPYLMDQCEKYKSHEYSTEIIQA